MGQLQAENALEREQLRLDLSKREPDGDDEPGEGVYYENPFEDPEYFKRFEDPQYHVPFRHESGQELIHKCTEDERRILRKEGDEFR